MQSCRHADLQTCRPADLQTCMSACLHVCMSACLHVCRPPDMHTCFAGEENRRSFLESKSFIQTCNLLHVCRPPDMQTCRHVLLVKKIEDFFGRASHSYRLAIFCMSAGLHVYRSAGLQVCRSAGLQVCMSACLHVCRPSRLQVCMNDLLSKHSSPYLGKRLALGKIISLLGTCPTLKCKTSSAGRRFL